MKLNQVIAVEKGIKTKSYSELTELHKICQKPDLFNGFAKQYTPKVENGESLPAEQKKVQYRVDEILARVSVFMTDLFDVTAAKDVANMTATGTVTVGSIDLAVDVPATYLLFLEKQLTDMRTFVEKLPELDDADNWSQDASTGIYKTDKVDTHRTKKLQQPIVLYPATTEHPAQTQLITEDVTVGYWETVKHSGGIQKLKKDKILSRIDRVLKATKFAREAANEETAQIQAIGQKIFDYLFTD